jgi:hypothetical protein
VRAEPVDAGGHRRREAASRSGPTPSRRTSRPAR